VEVKVLAAVVHGHLTALAEIEVVAVDLVHKVVEREATPQQHASLAILALIDGAHPCQISLDDSSRSIMQSRYRTVDDVLGLERDGRAEMRGGLAVVGHVEGDAALALHVVQDVVHRVERDHALVDLDQGLLIQLYSPRQ